MTLRELFEERNKIIAEQKTILEKGKDKTDADDERYTALDGAFDKIDKDIDRLNDMEKREEKKKAQAEREAAKQEPGKKDDEKREGEKTDDEKAEEKLEQDKRAVMAAYFRDGIPKLTDEEKRDLQADTGTKGGYMVPKSYATEIIKEMDDLFQFRQFARKFTLDSAESLGTPKRTARASTFTRGTEVKAPTADTALAFGERELVPHPMTGEIIVSRTLLRQSNQNVEGIIREELAYDAGQLQESEFMTGSGAQEPLGVFVASADGISTGRDVSTGNSTTDIGADNIIEVRYTLKEVYERNARWVYHRDAIKRIRKLKGGDGNYLWEAAIKLGEPDALMGFPIVKSEWAPNTFTSGLYVGLFGDITRYWIVDSLSLEIQRLDELLARTNQVSFIGRLENDGAPVLEEAFVRSILA